MGIYLYWKYHFQNPSLEGKIGRDHEEHQGVRGLREGYIVDGGGSVSVSDMSKFIPDAYPNIYAQMMEIFQHRCWRFPECYVTFGGPEFANSTLILRRRMIYNTLPLDVIKRTDLYLKEHTENERAIINRLALRHLKNFGESEVYAIRAAWNLYRYQVLEKYGASILVAEDSFTDERWEAIGKRVKSAKRVKLEKTGKHTFSARGSSGAYDVNVETITCTCADFQRRCRRRGMHCKHLVAALQQQGLWDRYWKDDLAVRSARA